MLPELTHCDHTKEGVPVVTGKGRRRNGPAALAASLMWSDRAVLEPGLGQATGYFKDVVSSV